jgi:hypothetical protein
VFRDYYLLDEEKKMALDEEKKMALEDNGNERSTEYVSPIHEQIRIMESARHEMAHLGGRGLTGTSQYCKAAGEYRKAKLQVERYSAAEKAEDADLQYQRELYKSMTPQTRPIQNVLNKLPDSPTGRKTLPIMTGAVDYFPLALAEVAKISKAGNEQHNPGQPLHWARGKSSDHADCVLRHLVERGTIDKDGQRHTAKAAWRALALLQEELEAEAGWKPRSKDGTSIST